jgi:hypothetical protein
LLTRAVPTPPSAAFYRLAGSERAIVGMIRGMRRGQEGKKGIINGVVLSVEGTSQGKSKGIINYQI